MISNNFLAEIVVSNLSFTSVFIASEICISKSVAINLIIPSSPSISKLDNIGNVCFFSIIPETLLKGESKISLLIFISIVFSLYIVFR